MNDPKCKNFLMNTLGEISKIHKIKQGGAIELTPINYIATLASGANSTALNFKCIEGVIWSLILQHRAPFCLDFFLLRGP